jgi:hypothetical protein
MTDIRIPRFLQERFSECKSKKEKDELSTKYKRFLNDPILEELVKYCSKELEREIKEEESKSFVSAFLFKYSFAFSRGKRSLLRTLLKQIKR